MIERLLPRPVRWVLDQIWDWTAEKLVPPTEGYEEDIAA